VASVDAGPQGSADEPLYVICRSGGRGQQACEIIPQAGFSKCGQRRGRYDGCVEADLPARPWQEGYLTGAASSLIAAGALVSAGAILGWFVNSCVHLVFGLRWSRADLRPGLPDTCGMGMDHGTNALEPMHAEWQSPVAHPESPSKEYRIALAQPTRRSTPALSHRWPSMYCPVTQPASSEASHAATPAMSPASPSRPRGCVSGDLLYHLRVLPDVCGEIGDR